jgi:predicted DNA-binding protein with PD1-like motif
MPLKTWFRCGGGRKLRVVFSAGRLSKAVIIRVLPGSDLIEAIEQACKETGIQAGIVVSCIGTLQRASFLVVVPVQNKVGAKYGDPLILEGPLEFLGAQGTVGLEESGDIFVHLHGLASDKDGIVHGGHLVKGQCPVLITCEVSVTQVEGVSLVRRMDPEVDMKVLMPS